MSCFFQYEKTVPCSDVPGITCYFQVLFQEHTGTIRKFLILYREHGTWNICNLGSR